MNQSPRRDLTVQFDGPAAFGAFLKKMEGQMQAALPKHMKADRMARLALTVFSTNPDLALCSQRSVAGSLITACQLGLEPNVNGQCYLIPYKGTCTLVPGWKGLVDLANRSGRCTVWTGAVYKGDDFDYALGDNPFVRHKPGESDEDAELLTHVYAVGKIRGNDVPVIEVWPIKKVYRHRDRYNKVGARHYSFQQPEMYARKVALLQVLKYMPQSIELTAAMEASNAAERGANVTIDAQTWVVVGDPAASDDGAGDDDTGGDNGGAPAAATHGNASARQGEGGAAAKPLLSDAEFKAKEKSLRNALASGQKVNDLITALETRNTVSVDQKTEIASWAQPATQGETA